MVYHVYQDEAGDWRWRLVARNNRIVADSGEGYTRPADVWRALRRVKVELYRAPIVFD